MRVYPSKLLLFGEHILLLGGTALAVPVPAFCGAWSTDVVGYPAPLSSKLLQFARSEALRSLPMMQAEQFYEDLCAGLVFEASIPVGYGLGSSGALCAGVYDRYATEKTTDLSALKSIFAQMESFFHGASSGIDPLTSYLNLPLLIEAKTRVTVVETPVWPSEPIVFLIDTRLPRKTEPLVAWFLAQQSDAVFSDNLKHAYLPAHEALVRSWLHADVDTFWEQLGVVSRYQLQHFDPLVPVSVKDLWQKHAHDSEVLFKLCGAGGGGYLLGFARDASLIDKLAPDYQIVMPFQPVVS
jgi:mevalonate kinase